MLFSQELPDRHDVKDDVNLTRLGSVQSRYNRDVERLDLF